MRDLREALAADPVSPTWIADQMRLLEVMGLYNPARDRDAERSTEAQKAALVAWVQALQGIPSPFVVEAFAYWRRTGTRWPVPGDIANRAQENIRDARRRMELDAPKAEAPAPFAPPATISEEERARRAAIYAEWQKGRE